MSRPTFLNDIVNGTNAATLEVYRLSKLFFVQQIKARGKEPLTPYVNALLSTGWRAQIVLEALVKLNDPSSFSVVCGATRTLMELGWDVDYLRKFKNVPAEVQRYHDFNRATLYHRYLLRKGDDGKRPLSPMLKAYEADTAQLKIDKELFEKLYPKSEKLPQPKKGEKRIKVKKPESRNNRFNWTGYTIAKMAEVVDAKARHESLYNLLSLNVHGGPLGGLGATKEAVLDQYVAAHFDALLNFIEIAVTILLETGSAHARGPAVRMWNKKLDEMIAAYSFINSMPRVDANPK